MTEKRTLHMLMPLEHLSAFFLLLQQGVWLEVQTGCSVASLMTDQFGVAEKYIVERITTLFLDFKPIDDLETSYINDGSTLALSSAMPGLVGSTMRRGSHLAAMRGGISCPAQQHGESGIGRVKIKLFNLVMSELGATILAQGIYLSYAELKSLLAAQDTCFWQSFGTAILDGYQLEPTTLIEQIRLTEPRDEILFKVEFKR